MKRLLLLLILALPLRTAAQSKAVAGFFDRYAAVEGVTCVQLEPKMMQLISAQARERGDEELATLLGNIRFIRIIALKEGDRDRFVEEAGRALASGGGFPLVTSTTEQGQRTEFYLRNKTFSECSELVMLTYGAKETVFVDIFGIFDLKQVMRLSSVLPQ